MFAPQPQVEWSEIFANTRPVEIEIGSGKGGFLLAYARQHPETNLLGIENQPRGARLSNDSNVSSSRTRSTRQASP